MKILLLLVFLFSGLSISQNNILLNGDFENGLEGWTAINLSDSTQPTLWRVTNTRFISPNHSAAWNDSVTNTYPHNQYHALESPPIDIPLNARTFLKFKALIHLTLNGTYYHDYFFIRYTTNNGNTWNNFLPYAHSGQQLNWRTFPDDFGPTAYDELTSFRGKTMKFRIIARSDELDPNGLGIFLDDFIVYSQECEFIDLNEPNNNIATATPVELGDIVAAALCPQNDEDVYSFTAQQGEQITIVTQHSMPWTYLYFMNSNGNTLLYAYNEFTYTIASTGTYYVRVTGSYNHSALYTIYFNNRPSPDVIAVTDIPDDQGLKVRVKWQASFYDPQSGTGQIKEYQLWRKVNDTLSVNKNGGNEIKKMSSPGTDNILEEYWEYIVTVPALSNRPFLNYSYVASTLSDNLPTTFIIAAIPKDENDPIEWGTEGTGISIDNLSPGFDSYSVLPSGSDIKIDWTINHNLHPDVAKIEIYKGIYELFPPVPETKVAELPASGNYYTDSDLLSGYTYYYIIAATDFAGNITYSPAITTGQVTSVSENNFLPGEISLEQNFPNPFNPSTVIEFSLPDFAEINLTVYDVLGREVAQLAEGNFAPGKHAVTFNASYLSSGIYFYTLSAGNFKQSKKLILMR